MATSTLGSGTLVLAGTTSGSTTVTATAVAGTTTLTLPAATDTLVGRATTDTLINKTLTSPTITGGALNGTVGATTPSTGAFTTLSATGATTITAQLTASTGDGTYPIISKDTRAYSVGVTGPQLGFFGLDSTSTNNSLGAFRALAQSSQNGTLEARVLSSGSITTIGTFSSTGLAVTGLTDISAATSGQIKFPATQNASSNANTLDDYEEGTWTATITNVVGTYTLTTVNYAQYTKIGQMVYGFLSVTVTTSGTASDSMNFTLPFVPAREGSGTGRENVSSGDILISRIVTGGSGEGRLYKTSGAAAGAGTGTYVVSFMFLT